MNTNKPTKLYKEAEWLVRDLYNKGQFGINTPEYIYIFNTLAYYVDLQKIRTNGNAIDRQVTRIMKLLKQAN